MAAPRLALISKKIIKPSSPTPLSHRIQKLSLFDQLNPCSYMSLALFYPKQCNSTLPFEPSHISTLLENSLSRALTSYYPLAGTIRDGLHVECNDVGAEFLEAQIDCPMSEIFKHGSAEAEDLVFPAGVPWTPSKENLVVAQLNRFKCGGIAISACVSHKIVDGSSMGDFITHWSAMARNPCSPVPSFQFVGGSIFPPTSGHIAEAILNSKTRGNHHCITRKYLFSRSKINSLKAMIATELRTQSSNNIDPTSVEAASSFVYKCIASNSPRPSVFTQSVNLRPVMKKMLPQEFQGNASFLFMAPQIEDPKEIKLHRLISELRKEKEMYFSQDWREPKDLVSAMFEKVMSLQNQLERDDEDVDVYKCTSLSKFRFCDMDYGWGSPRRVCLGSVPINKKIMLMDNQNGDGLEVLVSLKEEDMSALETNSELLQFASPSLGL
ncbi:acyltransferase Pun1-like [Lycium ferocissimum]|uniref:acyltransferase Pun1-like n=1 Tax=Lycium ferocissimum TaxID=112874 RepID=UPI002814EB12|nr:acyltransferase Pun1-like [Lycium ferocissimum]